jgi:hypothetical protein
MTAKRVIKDLIILSILSMLLFSLHCGGLDERMPKRMWWYDRVEGWQGRELTCLHNVEYKNNIYDFSADPSVLETINREISISIDYAEDQGKDYWQTSCETLQKSCGDCEDLAILVWKRIREEGYPDEKIGMILGEKNNLFHVCAAVYYSEDDFYIIDPTGFYTRRIVKASEFLFEKDIKLILWFNLFAIHEY